MYGKIINMESNSGIGESNQETNINNQPAQVSELPKEQAQESGESPILPSTTLVALLGVFLGSLGIHDFVIGKKKLGIAHIVVSIIAVLIYLLSPRIIAILISQGNGALLINPFIVGYIVYLLAIANWIWAVVEVIIYSEKNHKKKTTNPTQSSSTVPPEEEQYQKLSASIRTVTKVASVSSIISIIAGSLILLTVIINLIFDQCEGSGCDGMAWTVVFIIWVGIPPTLLSFIFSIYTAVLAVKLKKISNNVPLKKSINITLALFATTISILVGIIIVWNIGAAQKSEAPIAQESEVAISTDMVLDSTLTRIPYDTRQLSSYKDCYSYDEDPDYRAARDIICSYLMYTYSNNWQDSISGDDFVNSMYTPGYLHGTDKEELGENLVFLMGDSAVKFELTRPKVYVAVPHRNCNMEYDENAISAWYLGYAPDMPNGQQDYYCVSYSQPDGLYSSETFEESLQELRDHYKDEEYNFTATYNGGAIIYDNAKFLEDLFSNYDARPSA